MYSQSVFSVLFSFLEAALKHRLTATEAETKYVISGQLKTHLALQCGS